MKKSRSLVVAISGCIAAVAGLLLVQPWAFAGLLCIPFYSQNNSAWKCNQLGTCSGWTIGQCTGSTPGGCAITAGAMLLKYKGSDADPAKLNSWLKNNAGYLSGCSLVWSKVADYDGPGGLIWVGAGSLTTPAGLKSQIDQGKLIVVKGRRSGNDHWVPIRGYCGSGSQWSDFRYWDPWDPCPADHNLGDGVVIIGTDSVTRVYQ